jgi:hypothetical protein
VAALAVPVNAGWVFFEGDAGWSKVTVGEEVSTVNVTAELTPSGFSSELGWMAIAV